MSFEEELSDRIRNQSTRAKVPGNLRANVESRHVQLKRQRLAKIALGAVAVVLMLAGVGYAAQQSSKKPTFELATGSEMDDLPRCPALVGDTEIIVWVNRDATDEQIQAVEGQLDLLSRRPFVYFNQAETYAEFVEVWADAPEVIESVAPTDLPTSFRILATDLPSAEVDSIVGQMSLMSEVERVEFGETRCPETERTKDPICEATKIVVWMRPDASAEQVNQVAELVAELSGPGGYRYIDRAETYEEFQEFWADDPDVIDSVDPDNLPESFRISTASLSTSEVEAITARLEAGVPQVQKVDISNRDC